MKITKRKLESLINEGMRREAHIPLMLKEVFQNGSFNIDIILEENERTQENFHKLMSMPCGTVEQVVAAPEDSFPAGYKQYLVGEFTGIVDKFEKTVEKYFKALKLMGRDSGSPPPECDVP